MGNKKDKKNRVAVIGLGRFGSSVCEEMMKLGTEVLAIDSDTGLVQQHMSEVTLATVADSTSVEALTQVGLGDFEKVIVAIGTNIQASILTVTVLSEMGIPKIWAKAISRQHARILERVGAHHIVLPEFQAGERLAHVVTGRVLDFIQFDEDYAMVKTVAPLAAIGCSLAESAARVKFGVTVVAVKHRDGRFTYATGDTVIEPGDVLIVGGTPEDVEQFAELPS